MSGVQRYADAKTAAVACGEQIGRALQEAVATHGQASFAFSGGSSPKPMFQHMATLGLPWENIYLFQVDERSVPPTHDESNYHMVRAALLDSAPIPESNVFRIQAELAPQEAAERYRAALRAHFQVAPGVLPRFSVIQLGMGPDAHTASLFPGEPLIEDREGLAAAVYVAKLQTNRITLLPGVLLQAETVVFLAGGADKAQPLATVLHGEYRPIEYPSQVVARNAANVTWYVDEAAAGQLAV